MGRNYSALIRGKGLIFKAISIGQIHMIPDCNKLLSSQDQDVFACTACFHDTVLMVATHMLQFAQQRIS